MRFTRILCCFLYSFAIFCFSYNIQMFFGYCSYLCNKYCINSYGGRSDWEEWWHIQYMYKLRNRCAASQRHEKPSKNKPAHRQTPKLPLPRPTPPRLNKIRLNISRCNIQQHLTMHWFDCLVEYCTMTTGAPNNAQIDMPSWTLGAIYRMYSKGIQLLYHLF